MTLVRIIVLIHLLLYVSACNPTTTTQDASQEQILELKAQISDIRKDLDATKKELADLQKLLADVQNKADQSAINSVKSKRREAALKIYKELTKLKAAVESGLNYAQYSERVANANAEIQMAAMALDDDTILKSSVRVLDAYEAAKEYWRLIIESPLSDRRFNMIERERYESYGVDFGSSKRAGKYKIDDIWNNARRRLEVLRDVLKRKEIL